MHKKKKRDMRVCRLDNELLHTNESYYQEQSWRIFRIMAEFVTGFEILKKYDCAVSFFGSARCESADRWYKDAEDLAAKLSNAGFSIITGGASGVMEAANKGAFEAGGESIGLNIELPKEQGFNNYLTEGQDFHYFFTRKLMLSYASEVYVFFPGGYGTLDEFFELVTLIQTKKIKPIPVVLVGKDYWGGLLDWIDHTLVKKYRTVSANETSIYHLTDSVDDAFDYIMNKTSKVTRVVKSSADAAVPNPTE